MQRKDLIYKVVLCFALLIVNHLELSAQQMPAAYKTQYDKVMQRTAWWREARFGMFIHFGAYAVPGRGEWVKSNERLTTEQYQPFVDAFKPTDYNPRAWAKLAKAAGMKYAVLTAKHHDGFSLFDSKLSDYTISKYWGGRDLVREFLDAFRAEGLRVGLYYSIIDWHHPDYPNVGNHPQRNDSLNGLRKVNWDNYLKYMHGQVEELITSYGKLDIMWFDYSFDEYSGEKWKARELVELVRRHQPDIILDNRLEIHEGSSSLKRSISMLGDFETPEQGVPDDPILDKYGNQVPWETCLTLNNVWGFSAFDHNWKSPELIIHTLINCVSKNGNLLLNVGPDARGDIPEESVRILEEVGQWMQKNGESIYGAGAAILPKPDWGRYTQKGKRIFAHWMYPHVGMISAKGLDIKKVNSIYLLANATQLPFFGTWWGNREAGNCFIQMGQHPDKPFKFSTVADIHLK
ncbi:alpha-L-fucosidase [Flavihumibacter sp. RY-1]|uniref:alpha-L-fucosidase n=1 Tax=Flavihumibacter fluminis TaxID=2909236 RepID=A0ABS9BDQ4_9BACT|nr:alpha-L-fucosidase [Flavihumibacter fluminis]MCF1713702.1 alpha-L-fucosidase [Flavihumibacter fluminis]